jgi:hypothetical protein
MDLAYISGDYAFVVQNAMDCLPKLANGGSSNHEQLVVVASRLASSLARLGDADALLGLQSWWRECAATGSKKLRWLHPLVDVAAGRTEKGLASLK